MTIRELTARVARALSGTQQREARFHVPLPLALQPFQAVLCDLCEQGREIDGERPPGELVCLVECVGTALVRPLKHETERSKSASPKIACPPRHDLSQASRRPRMPFPGRMKWTKCCAFESSYARRTSVSTMSTQRASRTPKGRRMAST